MVVIEFIHNNKKYETDMKNYVIVYEPADVRAPRVTLMRQEVSIETYQNHPNFAKIKELFINNPEFFTKEIGYGKTISVYNNQVWINDYNITLKHLFKKFHNRVYVTVRNTTQPAIHSPYYAHPITKEWIILLDAKLYILYIASKNCRVPLRNPKLSNEELQKIIKTLTLIRDTMHPLVITGLSFTSKTLQNKEIILTGLIHYQALDNKSKFVLTKRGDVYIFNDNEKIIIDKAHKWIPPQKEDRRDDYE